MFGSWPPPLWMAEFALMFSLCLRVSWRYARGIISTDNALFSRWDAPQLDRVVLDAVREDDAGKRRNQQTFQKERCVCSDNPDVLQGHVALLFLHETGVRSTPGGKKWHQKRLWLL